jgi:sulfite exporter TauE/SafE
MLHADRAFSPVRQNARVLPPRARFFMGVLYAWVPCGLLRARGSVGAQLHRRVDSFDNGAYTLR